MKKEVKDLWVEALRSGKYKQANGCLRIDNKFCCLGVLCDISKLNDWKPFNPLNPHMYSFNDRIGVLPNNVMTWAEMKSWSGYYIPSVSNLISLNDGSSNFEQIADIIEKYWEVL